MLAKYYTLRLSRIKNCSRKISDLWNGNGGKYFSSTNEQQIENIDRKRGIYRVVVHEKEFYFEK